MPCGSVDRSVSKLEKEDWEYDQSFHARLSDQWNDACDRVEKIRKECFW
jgi:hypothetical protein